MKQYNTINNLVGWLTFVVAAFTYCMTIEPTASFWDCPEFITTGYKLEVGHPPGAQRPVAGSPHGQYHECPDECRLYPVPVLEHYPPG